MAEPTTHPPDEASAWSGPSEFVGDGEAQFPELEDARRRLPPLHAPGARTLVRDRWERLVTRIQLKASPDEVWQALTDPAALKCWLAVCHGSLLETDCDCTLDFEDGEFFLCRPTEAEPPQRLQYLWRWLGIGQATSVCWTLDPVAGGTQVTVTEEAVNPPWDWQTWNGGGWPGILDQLAAYLRTGTEWRWPWRRVGPYVQIEIPIPFYQAWDQLFSAGGLRHWLQVMKGELAVGQPVTIFMGDASGAVEMTVREIVPPGQSPPSFLPRIDFALHRPVWKAEVSGRVWMEPAGWGDSLFQAVHYNWENVAPELQLSERKILTSFWAGAMRRARQMSSQEAALGPHSWS